MTEVDHQVPVKQQAEDKIVTIPDTVERRLHPLKQRWTFWYLNDQRTLSWEERLKAICTFSTVEEFWALYNNIRPPSGLATTCDYNVFKEGIQPMWEVEENAKGGRWLINIEKGRPQEIMDLIWLETIIATIGEQFGQDQELICGLVCNVRSKGSKISVWTRDHTADEGNLRIGNILRQKLLSANIPSHLPNVPLFDTLRYEDHDSCQKKSGSVVKARLHINAVEKMERPDGPQDQPQQPSPPPQQ